MCHRAAMPPASRLWKVPISRRERDVEAAASVEPFHGKEGSPVESGRGLLLLDRLPSRVLVQCSIERCGTVLTEVEAGRDPVRRGFDVDSAPSF